MGRTHSTRDNGSGSREPTVGDSMWIILAFGPLKRRVGATRPCFCGTAATYEMPNTTYCYCPAHARTAAQQYQRWFDKGGRSRYASA